MKRTIRLTAAVLLGGCLFAAALAIQYGNEIRVESRDGRYHSINVRTDGNVRIVRRLSNTPCVQGRNWGYDSNHIWVDDGCRAVFEYGRDNRGRYDDYDRNGRYGQKGRNGRADSYGNYDRYRQGNFRKVVVSSTDGRRVFRHIENNGVELLRTLSDHPCRLGRSWGYDYDGIWVDDGCRAEFAVRTR